MHEKASRVKDRFNGVMGIVEMSVGGGLLVKDAALTALNPNVQETIYTSNSLVVQFIKYLSDMGFHPEIPRLALIAFIAAGAAATIDGARRFIKNS